MILLDANIFIYLANGSLESEIILPETIAYATVTKIEVLGYPKITVQELNSLQSWLHDAHHIPLSEAIVDIAIQLRQSIHIGLGDAITAATALAHDIDLWTANTDDFKHIEGLKLYDPLTA